MPLSRAKAQHVGTFGVPFAATNRRLLQTHEIGRDYLWQHTYGSTINTLSFSLSLLLLFFLSLFRRLSNPGASQVPF
jgi:hypothetical protein